ncbi:MAG: hypothetical protein J6S42_08520, partial [Thermoguttaceae bacterium]|nr:hypothetical protein [Thermoguttaceae bacterium]
MKKNWSSRKLRLESLEERTLLAVIAGSEGYQVSAELAAPTEAVTWVVNTADDPETWGTADTEVSLREAIKCANDGDQITFSESLRGETITLKSQLEISSSITIDATGTVGITIDGGGNGRVFKVSSETKDAQVKLIALRITGGNSD